MSARLPNTPLDVTDDAEFSDIRGSASSARTRSTHHGDNSRHLSVDWGTFDDTYARAATPPPTRHRCRARTCAHARVTWAEIQSGCWSRSTKRCTSGLRSARAHAFWDSAAVPGPALLMAASSRRGRDRRRGRGAGAGSALARERLLPEAWSEQESTDTRLTDGRDDAVVAAPDDAPCTLITAFQPIGCTAGDSRAALHALESAAPLAERNASRGAGRMGPSGALHGFVRLRVARSSPTPFVVRGVGGRLSGVTTWRRPRAGLRPDGSGGWRARPSGTRTRRVRCAACRRRGCSTRSGRATDQTQVDKEVTEALQPYVRADGTVWMPNVFRYLIARTT